MRALQWAASPSACRSVLSSHMRLELTRAVIVPVVVKADSALLLASSMTSNLDVAGVSASRH